MRKLNQNLFYAKCTPKIAIRSKQLKKRNAV